MTQTLPHLLKPDIQPATRVRLVAPDSPLRESLGVLLVAVLVVTLMAWRFMSLPEKRGDERLQSYQRSAQSLESQEQTVYRSLLSSVPDIIDLMDRLGQWPEAALLEEEEVPPFAAGYLPPRLDGLVWVGYDGGTWVDYLGHAADGSTEVSYILRLIDLHGGYHPHPHPGIDYDPELAVAVQVWRYPAAQRPYPGERLPEAGWIWLVEGSGLVLQTVGPQQAGVER